MTFPYAIALEPPDQPEVIALIEALDAHQVPLYPAESHHGIDLAALGRPEVVFAVAREPAQGRAVACGAIVVGPLAGLPGGGPPDPPGPLLAGELKRMYTVPAHRGRGIARRLLARLEAEALARGCRAFALETGYLQPEAIGLYERSGYRRCPPFGNYVDDPNSVFLVKPAPAAAHRNT